MKRELSSKSRTIRSVVFFVTAGLLLTGCVRMTYDATLNGNGTMSGTIEETIPDSIVNYFHDAGIMPNVSNVADFRYEGWSQDLVANTCTLSAPEVTINGGRFTGFQPGNTILLYSMNMANASDVIYGTDISSVQIDEENAYIYLDDIVIVGGCADPGDYLSGGRLAAGNNIDGIFGDPTTDDELLTIESNIPQVDRAYFYTLYLLELGNGAGYVNYLEGNDSGDTAITDVLEDALDHPLAAGEFPSRLMNVPGLEPIRRNGAKGWAFTFKDMPIASANSDGPNAIGENLQFTKLGNEWKISMTYPSYAATDSFGFETPSTAASAYLYDRMMDAMADMAVDHSFTVTGVITKTNGDYNATKNSVKFGMSIDAAYNSRSDEFQPILNSVVGTAVKFTYKKKSLSKEGKAAVKVSKQSLLRAKKITIVGILDGTKTKASEKRKVKLLAQARVKALGKYLEKMGVKAKIKYSYSILASTNESAVIKAGQRKAVIQITK